EMLYMFKSKWITDARYFQIFFQLIFLIYGLAYLDWSADWQHYAVTISGCLLLNYAVESIRQKKWLSFTGTYGFKCWGLSVMISALSLCLLLKTNHWTVSILASFLTVVSKYVFK